MRLSASTSLLTGVFLSQRATAHTYVWGAFVNGIDQGTFRGIRTPAYNGAPPYGFANSPVKDLSSIDLRCNVLGDKQVPHTIKVTPGDNLTLDWHHDFRNSTDDVIASSHHGPAMIYLSPDPPADSSFVKIWEEGLYGPSKWATTADIAKNGGHMNVRIPAGLKAGYYLLRAEMVGLHEGDVSYRENPLRGAQFYPNCVQLEVTGDGDVELPSGVSFPGAYDYSDPGVVYNIYCSTETLSTAPCTTTYDIPGPTVWSGAWPTTTESSLGTVQSSTASKWSSWVVKSVVTSVSFQGTKTYTVGMSSYSADWSTTYSTPNPSS